MFGLMNFTNYAFLIYMVYDINVYELEGGGHTLKSLPKESLFPSSSFSSLTLLFDTPYREVSISLEALASARLVPLHPLYLFIIGFS